MDLNRPPDGRPLYPEQEETGLCPTETFDGRPIAATDVLMYFELLALLGYLHLRSARHAAPLLPASSSDARTPRTSTSRLAAVRLMQRAVGLNVLSLTNRGLMSPEQTRSSLTLLSQQIMPQFRVV